MELPQRKMFEQRLLTEHLTLDFPALPKESPETIFDFLVDENGKNRARTSLHFHLIYLR